MGKLLKFILILLIYSVLLLAARMFIGENRIVEQTINTLYYFIPLFAVWFTEKMRLGKIFKRYKLTLKGIDAKKSCIYIIGTAVLYPLLIVGFLYLGGNIFNLSSFGKILIPIGDFSLFGLVLPEGSFIRFLIILLSTVIEIILCGLTYNMLFALGGELGWRGFLGKNLRLTTWKRNLLTGTIWTAWWLPMALFRYKLQPVEYLYKILFVYVLFTILSFLLDNAYKNTRSLWVPSAIWGIIMSFSWPYTIEGNQLITGSFSLSGIIVITLLTLIFRAIYSKSNGAENELFNNLDNTLS